jgi:UDP-glucose 4-epimerase
MQVAGLTADQVQLEFTGGDRGWKGDVPVVRLNTKRIRSLGWTCQRTSRQALCVAMHSMFEDCRAGKL